MRWLNLAAEISQYMALVTGLGLAAVKAWEKMFPPRPKQPKLPPKDPHYGEHWEFAVGWVKDDKRPLTWDEEEAGDKPWE